eukprot:4501629-Pyramimonas_sp.AAC.1
MALVWVDASAVPTGGCLGQTKNTRPARIVRTRGTTSSSATRCSAHGRESAAEGAKDPPPPPPGLLLLLLLAVAHGNEAPR